MVQFPPYLGVNFRNSEFLAIFGAVVFLAQFLELVVAQFRPPSLISNFS